MGFRGQVEIGVRVICDNTKCRRYFTSVPKEYATGRFCSIKCARSYSRSKYAGHSEETRKKISDKVKAAQMRDEPS